MNEQQRIFSFFYFPFCVLFVENIKSREVAVKKNKYRKRRRQTWWEYGVIAWIWPTKLGDFASGGAKVTEKINNKKSDAWLSFGYRYAVRSTRKTREGKASREGKSSWTGIWCCWTQEGIVSLFLDDFVLDPSVFLRLSFILMSQIRCSVLP